MYGDAKPVKGAKVTTPGSGASGYKASPDQMDRKRAQFRGAQAMKRAKGEQRAIRKVKPRPIKPGYGRAWDEYPRNS